MHAFYQRMMVWGVLLFSPSGFAAADYRLMEDFLGHFPVLAQNGDRTVAGVAQIVADSNGVGFYLSPLPSASHPLAPYQLISGKEDTTLFRKGGFLLQEGKIQGKKVRIEYTLEDGFISLAYQFCGLNDCTENVLELGNGKSSGERVSMQAFLDRFQGKYEVLSINGVAPKPSVKEAALEVDLETNQCILTFANCTESGICDPGGLFFSCSDTPVYRNQLVGGQETFTIFDNASGRQKRYTWHVQNGQFLFINYQYALIGSPTTSVLEHVVKKMVDTF